MAFLSVVLVILSKMLESRALKILDPTVQAP